MDVRGPANVTCAPFGPFASHPRRRPRPECGRASRETRLIRRYEMSTIATPRRSIPFFVPILNPVMTLFVRLGVDLGPKMALITVRGRRTGRPLTTPITLFEANGRRYLFGTFGNTDWVQNARAAGELTLTRG